MVLASWVLNRQSMVAWAAFRSCTKAPVFRFNVSSSGSRCLRKPRDNMLDSLTAIPSVGSGQDSAYCRASACSEIQPPRDSRCRRRREGLVQGRQPVGIQIVMDYPHHSGLRVGFTHQPAHPAGEVLHDAPLGHRHLPQARQRPKGQEQVVGSLPPVLIVLPPRESRPGWDRGPRLAQQLGWWSRQSIPPAVGSHRVRRKVQHVLLGTYEADAPLGCTGTLSVRA